MKLRAPRLRVAAGATVVALLATTAAVTVPAAADVTTVAVDSFRTGWDRDEPKLTPSDVGAPDFGQLFATQLEGQVYAQPVLAKNTLLVVTETDKAYGLDPVSGAVRWTRDVGPAWDVAALGCGDLVPSIGITATPAVDAATGTAYFTAKVDDAKNPDHPRWEMHAIDITTGAERSGFPSVIKGSPDNDPTNVFAPRTAMQRPGLLLMDGVVYAGFASHCDKQPYVGYVVGIDATTGARTAMWAAETGNSKAGAGIWQSGGGLVSDGPGRIFLATGNGISPAKGPGSPTPTNLAESVVRLQVQTDRTLKAADFFSPVNNTNLDSDDTDLGSGGPMALPDSVGTPSHPHLLVLTGKDGRVFLLDRDHLGGNGQGAGGTDDVVQTGGPYNGVWGRPGFWGGSTPYVYLTPNGGPLSAFKVGVSGSGDPTLTRTGASDVELPLQLRVPGRHLRRHEGRLGPGVGRLQLGRRRCERPAAGVRRRALAGDDEAALLRADRHRDQVLHPGHRRRPRLRRQPRRARSSASAGRPRSRWPGRRRTSACAPVGTSVTKQVTVTAQKALTVSKVSTSAPFAAGAVTLPTTLAAGASLTVPVTLRPTAPGARPAA